MDVGVEWMGVGEDGEVMCVDVGVEWMGVGEDDEVISVWMWVWVRMVG